MKFPTIRKEHIPFYGKVIKEASSSKAASGSTLSAFNERIPPRIEFKERMRYYLSVGRVQNVTESMVLDIVNREWYYDTGNDETPINDAAVETMEAWEEDNNVSGFFAKMVRNWILNGVHIISPIDWQPLQLQSITGKSRDDFGKTLFYFQQINGVERKLPADDFIELPYIELDREAWPTGMFDALMNIDWLDTDGRDPIPALALYRQALQDNMKIHHKYASPRVIYTVPEATEEQINNDITPMVEGMQPGDRVVVNAEMDIKQETVDGNARFIEHVNKIIDEVESGLGSSKNRLITEPSAMADAETAQTQDDDRIMGIMERIRMFMNMHVIPRVTGLEAGEIVFKWGAKDSFRLELPEALEKAIQLNIIKPEQALVMLTENHRWKVPDMDEVAEALGIKRDDLESEQNRDMMLKQSEEPEGEKPDKEKPKKKEESSEQIREKVREEAAQIESLRISNESKKNKIVFMNEMNEKVNSNG